MAKTKSLCPCIVSHYLSIILEIFANIPTLFAALIWIDEILFLDIFCKNCCQFEHFRYMGFAADAIAQVIK